MLRLSLGIAVAVLAGALLAGLGLTRLTSTSPVSAPPVPTLESPAVPSATSDSTRHHLPAWVQTRQAAPLWSGADKQAVQFTRLPGWTFLKVTGAQNDRLQVEYAGDGLSRQSGPGWVAASDVQPSDPSGSWLRNHRPSGLFAEATASVATLPVPQWSWMLRLDQASLDDRLHVRLYSTDLARVVGEGWLPAADVGPTDAPDQSVWTGIGQPKVDQSQQAEFGSHANFIAAVAVAARASGASDAPVSVTVAQAILESNWGQSLLSLEANNYFGIKATGQLGNDGAVWLRTLEYDSGGSPYHVFAPFRAYKSLADSVADHSRLFRDVSLYRQALQVVDQPDEFAWRIARAGYSTDPSYASKVIDLMRRYDLYQFDSPAPPSQIAPAATTA